MFPRSSDRHDRFSNRQAVLFVVAIVLGAVGGWVAGSITGGMMLGAIVGALGILLVRPREESRASPPDDPPDTA